MMKSFDSQVTLSVGVFVARISTVDFENTTLLIFGVSYREQASRCIESTLSVVDDVVSVLDFEEIRVFLNCVEEDVAALLMTIQNNEVFFSLLCECCLFGGTDVSFSMHHITFVDAYLVDWPESVPSVSLVEPSPAASVASEALVVLVDVAA
ncbi:hypothetical protein GCK72_002575 [Caenorhabditis remanei]|uniref:Uncharacterized protein n=1 Tax=Caenorhabditis remanei TaxID=31234 RepID=A0A6A5HXL9_CAERE|nr:hypothetical protein GCK72_002575 [Caenorhabditis remanei]KAF1770752.1 hypothetical protein GCK72_002575 [Caenorhabditis remanei]